MAYQEEARANADQIEAEIDGLEGGHWNNFVRDYRSFFKHAGEIRALFKTLKPFQRDDRERLWNRLNVVCDEVSRVRDSARQDRETKSANHKQWILKLVFNAEVTTLFGFDPPDVEAMKAYGAKLNEAARYLSDYKTEMLGADKAECFARITEVREQHDLWWADLKQHKQRRHQDWEERTRQNIASNYERLRKAQGALQSVESHADDLRAKISSAWNDDFAARASEWLSEAEDKIRDITEHIAKIEQWIAEDEEKLR